MSILHIMDFTLGDKTVHFSPKDKKDLSKAKKLFEAKIKDGWLAFKRTGDKAYRMIRTFPKNLGPDDKIIVTPPVTAG